MAASRSKPRAARATTPRHVWLAGLGLVAIARREALAAPARLATRASRLQVRVGALGDALRARVQGQVEPTVGRFSAEVEARLAPVLDKLGLKKAHRPARKPRKAAKATSRRAPRQPAKRRARKA
ncbi:MAG TPA: hypothetical protein VGD42_22285 [Lysobacter sp.]